MSELDSLLLAYRLKALPRAGWLRHGLTHPESVAAHSWGVAWLVLLLLPEDLDLGRAMAYATLHDLAEATVGDITPHDGVPKEEKRRREAEAMVALCADLPRGDQLLQSWQDYASEATPEARFVKELDRLDMALQAILYSTPAHPLPEFLDSAAKAIQHPTLALLLAALRDRLTAQASQTPTTGRAHTGP